MTHHPIERPRASWALAGLALAALSAPSGLEAQFPAIEPGQTITGALSAADPRPSTRGPFKVYQFRARKGDRLTATMHSDQIDPYLRLARDVGGVTDELAGDDDGGGNGDARLRITIPDDGTYLLIAQSLAEDGEGAFTLALEPTPHATTDAPRPIRTGQTAEGELAETDAVQEDDGSFYDTWVIDARRGQRLVVVLESGAFDAFVSIGKTEPDGAFTSTASNDDGDQAGDSTNARMRVRIPESGTYEIRANEIGVATGPYRLTVFEGPEPPALANRAPIVSGEEVEGRLDENDAVLDDDSHYEYWIYQARRGEKLKVRMESPEFDTFVTFGRLVRGAFDEINANDDAPDGTDSELEVTIPRDGEYAIRAGTLGSGVTGSYTLSITRSR